MKKRSPTSRRQTTPSQSRSKSIQKNTAHSASSTVYPFTAIVGQDEMKLALILNVIDPLIGGVLIMGHRGTGKSTAVRALADLLPQINAVLGCPYQCDPKDAQNLCRECAQKHASGEKLVTRRLPIPIVDLPLGATEDRICGTIDIERALKGGVKAFDPGLLARANRGFLYIDEVNLLEDHLVDLLLDVAVTGRNKVEREGISVEHPARFVLIGSGNPEEGELRPQLLDRFGVFVEVKTETDPDRRMEIVDLRQSFDNDSSGFQDRFSAAQSELQGRIMRARKKSAEVVISRPLLRQIANLCSELNVDGHRGELTIARSARALAAFEGRKAVSEEDIRRVVVMSLSHRLRRDPLEETGGREEILSALNASFAGSATAGGTNRKGRERSKGDSNRAGAASDLSLNNPRSQSASPDGMLGQDSSDLISPATTDVTTKFQANDRSRSQSGLEGHKPNRGSRAKRSGRTVSDYQRGRYTAAINSKKSGASVALDATLRALLVSSRLSSGVDALPLPGKNPESYLRYKRFARKSGRLFILAIDASGSMALNRINQAKSAASALFKHSYVQRDRVAILTFRGTSAEVLLPPSRSMLRARRALNSLVVGGGTPLSAGLRCSLELAKRARRSDSGEIHLLLFTDGRANVAASGNGNLSSKDRELLIDSEIRRAAVELRKQRVLPVVIDTQNAFVENGGGCLLAKQLQGRYQRLPAKSVAGDGFVTVGI